MKLRSGKLIKDIYFKKENQPFKLVILPLKVEIDFDKASQEWRKNKIHLGNGCFKYKD